MVVLQRGRGYGGIFETGITATPNCLIEKAASKSGGRDIERQDAIAIEMKGKVQPLTKQSGFLAGTIPLSLGNAAFNFGNGYRRQEKLIGMCRKPCPSGLRV